MDANRGEPRGIGEVLPPVVGRAVVNAWSGLREKRVRAWPFSRA
jgi:CO/xanthine dehydrogenase Mo-binding subunit